MTDHRVVGRPVDPTELRRMQCEGKERYLTFELARRVVARRNRSRRNEGASLNAYHCQWCGFVHIGIRRHRSAKMRKPRFQEAAE